MQLTGKYNAVHELLAASNLSYLENREKRFFGAALVYSLTTTDPTSGCERGLP